MCLLTDVDFQVSAQSRSHVPKLIKIQSRQRQDFQYFLKEVCFCQLKPRLIAHEVLTADTLRVANLSDIIS